MSGKMMRESLEWKSDDRTNWYGRPRRLVIMGAEYRIFKCDNETACLGIPASRWWFEIKYKLPFAEDSNVGWHWLDPHAGILRTLERAKIFVELDHLQRTKTRCAQVIKDADNAIEFLQERLRELEA